MRKKYLSALLFGAILFTPAVTFTSCSDYDDDIASLQSQITDLENAISEIQSQIYDGKFVTNVTSDGQGLVITWDDNSTTTIQNVINQETGETESGNVVTIDEATGEILIDGVGSGYYASTDPETNKVNVPYVNEDGALVLIDENGDEVVTNILTAPVTAVTNTDGSVTLTIRTNGETQTVLIPSLASSITAVELLDLDFKTTTEDQELSIMYWVNANGTTGWKGPRGNIPAKSVLYSAEEGKADINFKLSPANIDGTGVGFVLVNSQDGNAPLDLTTPSNFTGLISRASTYDNGLYQTSVGEESKIFTYTTGASDFTSQFVNGSSNVIFALTPNLTGTDVRSGYQISVTPDVQTSAKLTDVIVSGVDKNANSYDYSTSIENTGTAIIKVGVTADVKVTEEYYLYDMYMEVTDAAKEKFGLEIDNEARTIIATQSPDDLTDATFDLYVYAMDNAGNQYKVTTITVTVNRTMAESAYDKQVKDLTKLTDTFTVSADPLFSSLGTQANDWKESVDLTKTTFELLEMNSSGELDTASEGTTSFYGSADVATSITSGQADGHVAFLNANGAITNSAAGSLANIRFNLNIPTAANDNPIKIDKVYYILLTFKTSDDVVLNTITVPFELNKPELSEILVQESGVFRDGDDLAYAYMYWQDAHINQTKTVDSNGDINSYVGGGTQALSRYYIDRAFNNMYANLSSAGMTTYTFAIDNDDKVEGTNKTSGDYASVGVSSQFTSQPNRYFIDLNPAVDDDNDGIRDGYKKDLIVNFSGHYLDVEDDTYAYSHAYKFRVMSPILEGEVLATNNLVEVAATGRTRIYKEDIWAKTYNNDVEYHIFKDTDGEYYRDDIKEVTFSSGNVNVFEVTVATPTTATEDVDSYIEVEGVSANTSTLNVAIEDIWGYTLEDQVDIQTTYTALGE